MVLLHYKVKMSLETIIETGPVIERLNDLNKYLPNQPELVYQFWKSVAYSLGDLGKLLTVNAFYIALTRALDNLKLEPKTVFENIMIDAYLLDRAVDISGAVCSKEFTAGVKQFIETDFEDICFTPF